MNDVLDLLIDAIASGDVFVKRVGAQVWGSPAGKSRIAKKLVSWFPSHKTYVEPFAGGAACFYAKEPSETEVLNDLDKSIVAAFRFLRDHTPEEAKALEKMDWKASHELWKKLRATEPKSPAENFHRVVMLRFASYFSDPARGHSPSADGQTNQAIKRLEAAKERLRGVKLHTGDYLSTLDKYDATDTFFFLDPPYSKTRQRVGEESFKVADMWPRLAKLRGKFMLTYDAEPPDLARKRYWIRKIDHTVFDGARAAGRDYKTYAIMNYAPGR